MISTALRTTGAVLALSALVAPTVATAATSDAYSPLVSLSMVASPQSQAALCAVGNAGASEAAAAAASSAATQAPPQGCVLPVADAAVAPLPSQAFAPTTNFSPILIGLGAIGLGVLLYALLHKDKDEAPPEAMSPA